MVDLVHYTVNHFLGQFIKMHLLLFKSCVFFLYMNILLFKSTVPLLMDMWVGSSPYMSLCTFAGDFSGEEFFEVKDLGQRV